MRRASRAAPSANERSSPRIRGAIRHPRTALLRSGYPEYWSSSERTSFRPGSEPSSPGSGRARVCGCPGGRIGTNGSHRGASLVAPCVIAPCAILFRDGEFPWHGRSLTVSSSVALLRFRFVAAFQSGSQRLAGERGAGARGAEASRPFVDSLRKCRVHRYSYGFHSDILTCFNSHASHAILHGRARESLKNPCRDSGIYGKPLISRSSKRFK